ncbi:MAG: DNA repair protein RadC [Sterolibacteriaceae bacterium]|nr:DNA repair protein RadC [Sterolibacteriaceae bacterium]
MNFEHLPLDALRAELLREPEPLPAPLPSVCSDCAPLPYAPPGFARMTLFDYRLAVARQILLRAAYEDALGKSVLTSPSAAREYFALHVATLPYEVFLVAYLDAQHRVIAVEEAFRGTLTATSVYPREIVRQALSHNAAAIVACHQHPSGSATISRADEVLTAALNAALALVDVRFIDHLVFAAGRFASFAEAGLL